MSVKITSEQDGRLSIQIDESEVAQLLNILCAAKFRMELRSEFLLSPLLNEIIEKVLEFNNSSNIPPLRPTDGYFNVTKLMLDDPRYFPYQVRALLLEEDGLDRANELLTDALYPYRLVKDESPSDVK